MALREPAEKRKTCAVVTSVSQPSKIVGCSAVLGGVNPKWR